MSKECHAGSSVVQTQQKPATTKTLKRTCFKEQRRFQEGPVLEMSLAITVGARIPNKFGIRMVQSCSVLVPTIQKPNFKMAAQG